LPTENVKYLLLTPKPLQAWISCTLRRQIFFFEVIALTNAAGDRVNPGRYEVQNQPALTFGLVARPPSC
jgi:hypothetical protein